MSAFEDKSRYILTFGEEFPARFAEVEAISDNPEELIMHLFTGGYVKVHLLEETKANAILGALVRGMPFGWRLHHSQYPRGLDGCWIAGAVATDLLVTDETGPTPEAALSKALPEQ